MSSRAPRRYLADRRDHCDIGNASKAGSAVVKARATWGRRLRSPNRLTACAIMVDSLGAMWITEDLSGAAALARLAWSTELTKVPAPVRDSSRPSETRRSNTSMMVVLESPSSRARVRLAGRRSPGKNPPVRIISRSATQSCVLTG